MASAASILGGVTAAYQLQPNLTVSGITVTNPKDPFSTSFTVVNGGYFSLRSLRGGCHGQKYELINVPLNKGYHEAFTWEQDDAAWETSYDASAISAGESFSVPCRARAAFYAKPAAGGKPMTIVTRQIGDQIDFDEQPVQIRNADVILTLQYHLGVWPLVSTKHFRFSTRRNDRGEILWVPEPLASRKVFNSKGK
ncbi:MAG: hypothetical protein ABJC09_10795 [Terriglobia bacterium]